MSEIKDSFDDEELTELADEIRKDLLVQPSLHPNDSFVFKLEIDHVSDHEHEQTKHKSPPSWSYLSLSNTEEYTYDKFTPFTPNTITPYSPPRLLNNESFPDISSPKTSLKVTINNGYHWVKKSYSQKLSFNTPTPQLTLNDISSINSDSTIISPRNRKQKPIVSPSNESAKSKSKKNAVKHNKNPSKKIISPVLMKTFDEFQKNNKRDVSSSSMEVNFGNSKEYAIEFDDGFIFVNSDNL